MSALAKLSLRNRGLIGLLAILVLGFGALALPQLKQQLYPSLQLPSAVVVTPYPGASPDAVDRQLTQPIEGGIQGITGVEEVTSTSSEGSSTVVVQFAYGTDIDASVSQLQQAVNRLRPQLPENAESTVTAGGTDDIPVVILAASAPGDQQQFAERLTKEVVPELRKIDDVREATVTGTQEKTVTIDVDYAKLGAAGVDPTALATALKTAGAAIPAGTVEDGDRTLTVEVGGGPVTVDSLRNLQLSPRAKLGDVASVEPTLAAASSITRTNGKPSLGINVTMVADGSAVAVSDAVAGKLPELSQKLGAELTPTFDQGPQVAEAVSGLTTEGLLGLAFAVVVILLFLLSVRSTLVTAVSIPLSVVVALLALWAGDLSLNLLTLGALTIAVGRVVDDSIVVLENIKRHLGYGEGKQRAVLNGVREVAGAVTASTLTTVAVFLPIAFVGGMAGELFSPFSLTVTVALLASLLVSLTVVPVLAYWFLKPPKAAATAEEAEANLQRALEKERRGLLQRIYVPVIRFATRRRLTVVLLSLLVFAGTIGLSTKLETNFLDDGATTTTSLRQTFEPGTGLDTREQAAIRVEQALAATGEVEKYQVTVGNDPIAALFGGSGASTTSISITVKEGTDLDAFENRLRDSLSGQPGLGELEFGGAAAGPASDEVSVTVTAPDEASLRPAADAVQRAFGEVSGLTGVTNDLATGMPRVQIEVDQVKAAERGLSATTIGQLANQAIAGQTVTQLPVDGTRTDIVLRTGDRPDDAAAVAALPLPSATGIVRLDQVATVRTVDGPTQVKRTDGELSTTVSAKTTGGDLSALTQQLTTKLDGLSLTGGAAYSLGGVSQEQNEAFADLGLAMLAAIAIVFLIMVATFRSLVQPLILLVSIPFAATGAIGLLLFTGTALGLPALIGMLMLIGIVVTNAIVLIDLVNQYRAEGMSVSDAVVEGGRRRLRPILMTAAATIFALVPMALGLTGQGGFIGQPLAIVVIGGLVSSTVLTLILVPTLYTVVEGRKERRRAKKAPRTETPELAGAH
ncbi:efflux RND transporter permease subunit [Saccharothrix sp. AJ9571]|nr:efflux RND transporter permease subunit [Saccharothrix sp. AJ9571]